jgi:hypothetical protein
MPIKSLETSFRVACDSRLVEAAHALTEEPVRELFPLLQSESVDWFIALFSLEPSQQL